MSVGRGKKRKKGATREVDCRDKTSYNRNTGGLRLSVSGAGSIQETLNIIRGCLLDHNLDHTSRGEAKEADSGTV